MEKLSEGIEKCVQTWQATLAHFGIARNVSAWERTQIGRAAQNYGSEMVELALFGARFEKKTENFDPKDYVSLSRIIEKDREGRLKIDMYANAGARKRKTASPVAPKSSEPEQEQYVTDPKRVREILGKAFGGISQDPEESDQEIERRKREQLRRLKEMEEK